jgi:hypothetical protein
MILLCVSSGVENTKKIFRLTGIKPKVVEERIQDFTEKYVTREPSSFLEKLFPKLRLTNLGRDALRVFDEIYAKDADCLETRQKLMEILAEKSRNTYDLRTS